MGNQANLSVHEKLSRGDAEDLIELNQILLNPHKILFQANSPFQEVLLVKSENVRLYLNKQLQFSSLDESIYHEALVRPAMTLASKRERILIVGGSDGLILREVLNYPGVKRVCLVDNDPILINLSRSNPTLVRLNNSAFSDERVHIHEDNLDKFLKRHGRQYDLIIVDFLDPANKDISVKYRRKVFKRLSNYLSEDGILVCQGNSPTDAALVFWGTAKTLQSAGLHTLSYHVNVPTFGDWGFHLAAKYQINWAKKDTPTTGSFQEFSNWFELPEKTLNVKNKAEANTKHNLILHQYYADSVGSSATGIQIQNPPNSCLIDDQRCDGDLEDLVELRQIQLGPHRILHQSLSSEHEIVLIEATDIRMYLDKQLQFSSVDEGIYHEALVHPAFVFARSHNRILIVGGGDGLAAREVLKYRQVKHIDLVDLDPIVLHVASNLKELVEINNGALNDSRVHVYPQDAQVFIKEKRAPYDVIIVDFPDPSDEIVSRLYTTEFFTSLTNCLEPSGIIVCQSHSPVDAGSVYWSIGRTLESAGLQTLSYHVDVPSFGDWGFHLACRERLVWSDRLVSVDLSSLQSDLSPLFYFTDEILETSKKAIVNTLSELTLHILYTLEVGIQPEND